MCTYMYTHIYIYISKPALGDCAMMCHVLCIHYILLMGDVSIVQRCFRLFSLSGKQIKLIMDITSGLAAWDLGHRNFERGLM